MRKKYSKMKILKRTGAVFLMLYLIACYSKEKTVDKETTTQIYDSILSKENIESIETTEHIKNSNLLMEDSLTILSNLTNETGFDIVFNENKRMVSLKLSSHPNDLIPIGNLYNTFGQAPHEVKIEGLDSNNFVIFIFTNQIRLGISADHIYVCRFNKPSKKIVELCKFDQLGVYDEQSGIDTMHDIKQFDYYLNRLKNDRFQVEVIEYKPYKFELESKNKNFNYVIQKRYCNFSVND